MYGPTSKLYNNLQGTYFDEYYHLSDTERKNMDRKYKPKKLSLDVHNYDDWSENEEFTDKEESTDKEKSVDLSNMPPLEGDKKEVKEGKGLKILTPNKLLIRLTILLVQINARNNSYKLKNEIRQILYLLYQHNKITKKVYNNLVKSL